MSAAGPRLFVLTLPFGPSWDATRERREQPGWAEHAAFMDGLVDDGFVILGGPVGDGSEAMLVVDAADEEEVRARLAGDPWIVDGILTLGPIEPWAIWLDGRASRPRRRAVTLTETQADLLRRANFAVATTLGSDGSPQTSVVWVDVEDCRPVFNTTTTRAKCRNLQRDPRVNLLVWELDDPYRYLEIEGTVELDEVGATAHIDKLSRKYRGHAFPNPTNRVVVRVAPRRVHDYLDGPPPRPVAALRSEEAAVGVSRDRTRHEEEKGP